MKKILLFGSILCILLSGCKKEDDLVNPPPVNPKPIVEITSIENNSSVSDQVVIAMRARDPKGIGRIELYIDGYSDQRMTFLDSEYTYIWDIRDLQEGSVHSIYAKAFNKENVSDSTDVIHFTVRKFAPGNLNAVMQSDSAVVLTWSDECSFETGYEIDQGVAYPNGGAIFNLIKTVGPNTTRFVIEDKFQKDLIYAFRVRAIKDTAKSAYSERSYCSLRFFAPAELTVEKNSYSTVTLSWQFRGTVPPVFEIEQKTNDGSFQSIGKTTSSTFIVKGLSLTDNNYYYRVRALYKYVSSDYSGTAIAEKIDVQAFGPVRIYGNDGTLTALQSGIILSTGSTSAIGSSAPDRDKIDLFYNIKTHTLSSSTQLTGFYRGTAFMEGSSTSLNDGAPSPLKDYHWLNYVNDNVNNYIFIYDNDRHYSKLRIVRRGQIIGMPPWVEVEWLYNKAADNRLFGTN